MKNRVVSSLQESFVYVTALQSPACARTSPSTKRGALLPRLLAALPFLIASALLTSCQKADDFYYTGARVSFTYTYTNTIPELNAALGSMGEFCTIRTDGQNFIFSGLKTSTTRPLTAADTRVHPALGLSGLIVGLPNIPDVGADVSRVVNNHFLCVFRHRNIELPAAVDRFGVRLSRASSACSEAGDVEIRMILKKRKESLTDHSGSADDADS